jgi:hypothetical protein
VAVVVPDKKAITAWASDNGLGSASFEELCNDSKVHERSCLTLPSMPSAAWVLSYYLQPTTERFHHHIQVCRLEYMMHSTSPLYIRGVAPRKCSRGCTC